MTSVIGHVLIFLAGMFSFFQFICPLDRIRLLASLSVTTFFFVTLTFFFLVWSYVISDFSIINVALNSHTQKPLLYKISGVWGNHEGSILLWVFLISFISLISAFQIKSWGSLIYSYVLKQMGFIIFILILFIFTTSDPFWPMYPVPKQGAGLNPLLQDPLLSIHPPILYMGYAIMSLIFSLSLAILKNSNKNQIILFSFLRPWASLGWAFSTLSLLLGSYWAYYQLGWGGWWFWDPVESASLLPWLSLAGTVHILRVVRSSHLGLFFYGIISVSSFCFAILSTFFVRSGILSSVHSFADDGGRGFFLLFFLLFLFFQIIKELLKIKEKKLLIQSVNLMSREGYIYIYIILVCILLSISLLGIIYPLVLEKIFDERITIGEPYFLKTFIPISWIGMIIASFSLIFSYYNIQDFRKKLFFILKIKFISIVFCYIVLLERDFDIFLILGLLISVFLFLMTSCSIYYLIKVLGYNFFKSSLLYVAIGHLGLSISCIGMSLDRGFGEEINIALSSGESVYLKGLKLSMLSVDHGVKDNYFYERVLFSVELNNKKLNSFYSEKRFFKAHQVLTTKVGLFRYFFSEIYIVPGPPVEENSIKAFKIQYRPYVYLIWLGGLFIVFSLVSASFYYFRQLFLKPIV